MSLTLKPSDPRSAFVKARGEYTVLHIDKVERGLVYGQIAFARSDAWPRILRNDGNIVSLKEEGYIYEPTHFALFVDDRLLLVEYNHYGPRIGALQTYIQTKVSDLRGSMPFQLEYFVAKQLLRQDQFEELLRSSDIASFEIEISTDAEVNPNGDLERMLYYVLPDAREHRVAYVKIAFSRPKNAKRGGIYYEKTGIIDFVRKFASHLKRAQVKVEPEPSGKSRIELIDLLAGRYAEVARPILQGRSIESNSMYEELNKIRDKVMARIDLLSD